MAEDLSKLNLVELLDRLETIPEPEPISFLPQTVAWIWIGLTMLAVTVWFISKKYKKYRVNHYRRVALQEIAQSNRDPVLLANILRRTALVAFPRSQVASLHGDDWLAFLNRTYPGEEFSSELGRVLISAPYTNHPTKSDITSLVTQWIRTHSDLDRSQFND